MAIRVVFTSEVGFIASPGASSITLVGDTVTHNSLVSPTDTLVQVIIRHTSKYISLQQRLNSPYSFLLFLKSLDISLSYGEELQRWFN
jgi:hypothetical protein